MHGSRRLTPGRVLEFAFSELPATLWARANRRRRAARMLVCLPRDYSPARQFPIMVFLGGGHGAAGSADDADRVRKLTGDRGLIGVSLPLFKKDLDPAEIYGGLLIRATDDCPLIARCYRRMLGALFEAVPNVAPGAGALGGFSNGAHATAMLLSALDPFTLRHFRSFYFVDGGVYLASLHKLALRDKRFLYLVGASRRKKWRRWMFDVLNATCQTAWSEGRDLTLFRMPRVGHAFPPEHFERVRRWVLAGGGPAGRRPTTSRSDR